MLGLRRSAPFGRHLDGVQASKTSALRRQIRAVMLERLGPNVWHNSPAATNGRAGRTRGDGEAVAAQPPAGRAADQPTCAERSAGLW